MSNTKRVKKTRKRRTERLRRRIAHESSVPRVTVYRSAKQIYAQVVDDDQQKTVASYSSLNIKDAQGDKKQVAYSVGKELSKLVKDKGITKVVFDRGPYLYHGRVKALAEGLREGGIQV